MEEVLDVLRDPTVDMSKRHNYTRMLIPRECLPIKFGHTAPEVGEIVPGSGGMFHRGLIEENNHFEPLNIPLRYKMIYHLGRVVITKIRPIPRDLPRRVVTITRLMKYLDKL